MFTYAFTKNSGTTLTSGVSAAPTTGDASDYVETDVVVLTDKRYDGKNLSLYIDVPATSGDSSTSAFLDFYIAGGYNSSVTFPINYNSGTSLIINNTALGGTSQGAAIKYRKYTPVLMHEGGSTQWLKSIPYIRLGCRSTWHKGSGASTVVYNAWLIVG